MVLYLKIFDEFFILILSVRAVCTKYIKYNKSARTTKFVHNSYIRSDCLKIKTVISGTGEKKKMVER